MQPRSKYRASGVSGCVALSRRGSELELSSTHAAEEGMEQQMCSEWPENLIAIGGRWNHAAEIEIATFAGAWV